MAKNRKNTIPVLIDIRYRHSYNKFEEEYGEGVSYSRIEQTSYLDLKSMVFEKISRNIKFRKYLRENRVLTLKADMMDKEYDKFMKMRENDEFDFLHDFIISNVSILTDVNTEEDD